MANSFQASDQLVLSASPQESMKSYQHIPTYTASNSSFSLRREQQTNLTRPSFGSYMSACDSNGNSPNYRNLGYRWNPGVLKVFTRKPIHMHIMHKLHCKDFLFHSCERRQPFLLFWNNYFQFQTCAWKAADKEKTPRKAEVLSDGLQ